MRQTFPAYILYMILYSLRKRGITLNGEDGTVENTFDPIQLRMGQCWVIGPSVIELVGLNGPDVEFLEWKCCDNVPAPHRIITVDTQSNFLDYPKGLGTNRKMPITDLIKSTQLVERSWGYRSLSH